MFVSEIIDEVLETLGTTDRTKAFRKLSQAVQALMQSGHYFHTNAEVDVCSGWDGMTITLPRGVEVPLGVNVDGSPTYFRNRLFQYHINKGGMYNPVSWAWDDRGMVATQMDIRQPAQLVAVAEHEADAGKIIRVVGTDSTNRELRSQTPDGTGLDGLLVRIHAQSDFPYGTIAPDGVTIVTRATKVAPITNLANVYIHEFSTGQAVVLTDYAGDIPSGLVDREEYYVQVLDNYTVSLHQSELDAKNGINAIRMQSIEGSIDLQLSDTRPVQLATAIALEDGLPSVPIDPSNEVTFARRVGTNQIVLQVLTPGVDGGVISSIYTQTEEGVSSQNLLDSPVAIVGTLTAQAVAILVTAAINGNAGATGYTASLTNESITITFVTERVSFVSLSVGVSGTTPSPTFGYNVIQGGLLPSPLLENSTYFVQQLDAGLGTVNLQVYASLSDAQNRINEIPLIGSSDDITTYIRKPFVPQTKLVFTAAPNFSTGDTVQANTNGGTLPQPLITGQNYYVHVLDQDPPAVTLHTTYAEAVTGINPINITTAGSGQNSIAKLLTATVSPGTKNNVSVTGLDLPPASGSGAIVTAQSSGPVTQLTLGTGGGGYTAATATITDVGGYGYTIAPSIRLVGGNYTAGATLSAAISTDLASGIGYVSAVSVIDGGQGYDSANAPRLTFSGGLIANGTPPNAELKIDQGLLRGAGTALSPGTNVVDGQALLFGDTGGAGTGAFGYMVGTGGSSYNIKSAGTGYKNPTILGAFLMPIRITFASVTGTGTLSSVKVFTASNPSGIELIGGTAVAAFTTTALAATNLVAAINANTVNSGYAASVGGAGFTNVVTITPVLAVTVATVGSLNERINNLFVTTLSNSGATTGTTSAKFDLFVGAAYTLVAADILSTTAMATAIRTYINTKTATTGYSATSSGSVIYITPPAANFVNSAQVTTNGISTYTYTLPLYSTLVTPTGTNYTLSTVFIQPTFSSSLPLTGVISGVNLLPYGSGATATVSVNSISNAVNGVSLTATGSGYLYPPRVNISSPNMLNPQLVCISAGQASSGAISAVTAKLKNGTVTVNLMNATFTNSAAPSTADVANGIATQIAAKFATTGWTAAVLASSSDTVVIYPPAGVAVESFSTTTTGTPAMSFTSTVPQQATCGASVTTSFVTKYVIQNSGSGYTTAPAVNITGGGGTGATATATIDKFGIGTISVNSPGTGYPVGTTCYIIDTAGGTGTGATAFPSRNVSGGIDSITVTNPGNGYANPAIVFVDPAGGTVPSTGTIVKVTSAATASVSRFWLSFGTGSVTPNLISIAASSGSGGTQAQQLAAALTTEINRTYSIFSTGNQNEYTITLATSLSAGCAAGTRAGSPGWSITGANIGAGATIVSIAGSGASTVLTLSVPNTGLVNGTVFISTGYTAVQSVPDPTAIQITAPSGVGVTGAFSTAAGTFTYTISTGADVSFTYTGVVTDVNVVAEGTGYTSIPIVTINPSTGVFVEFSSTGSLPSPLIQGNSYRAENPSSGSSFTLKNADFSDVNITSTGSGTLYLVLSRSFAIGFTGKWSGDFSGFSSLKVRLQTDYQLPITLPPTDSVTSYWLLKETSTSASLYLDPAGVNLVTPLELGVGQSYFAVPARSAAIAYNNEIIPSFSDYLKSGMSVKFTSTDGVLPSPLTSSGSYLITVNSGRITVNNAGAVVQFTDLGHGNMSMVIARTFFVVSQDELQSENCTLETGDEITVRPSVGDSLPHPLTQSEYASPQSYWVRRTSQNSFNIYTSKEQALSRTSSAGRISLLSIGDTVDSFFYSDLIQTQTLVKSVQHVEKPITVGYVSLYAFDYGRSNDMALIGQYHPSETNPKYRRIRIGKPCAWVRMIYRVKSPEVTSVYDYVPLESARAIIAAVHAIDLEDKDFLEQAQKYWQTAISYLKNETESMDGHAMIVPQINNITYGDGTDLVMF